MATKLGLYNGALRHLGDARLTTLTDAHPGRLRLDDVYDSALAYMLEKGMWRFALRVAELSNDTGETPQFGKRFSFEKPDDFVRLIAIGDEETFAGDFERFDSTPTHWFADSEPLFIQYVSNDAAYGLNLAAWPEAFTKAVEAYMAYESGIAISNDRGTRSDMYQLHKRLLAEAKSLDAIDERVQGKPVGRLVRARHSFVSGRQYRA